MLQHGKYHIIAHASTSIFGKIIIFLISVILQILLELDLFIIMAKMQ